MELEEGGGNTRTHLSREKDQGPPLSMEAVGGTGDQGEAWREAKSTKDRGPWVTEYMRLLEVGRGGNTPFAAADSEGGETEAWDGVG